MSVLGEVDFMQLCSDQSVFDAIFEAPKGSSVDMGMVRQGICNVLGLNMTALIEQLMANTKGLPELYQKVSC